MTELEIRQDERSRVLGEVAARAFARARDRETAASLSEVEDSEEGPSAWTWQARALRAFAETLCHERTGPRSTCGHLAMWRADVGLCAHPDCRRGRGESGAVPPALDELARRCVELLPIRTDVRIAKALVDALRDAWALGRGEVAAAPQPAPGASTVAGAGGPTW